MQLEYKVKTQEGIDEEDMEGVRLSKKTVKRYKGLRIMRDDDASDGFDSSAERHISDEMSEEEYDEEGSQEEEDDEEEDSQFEAKQHPTGGIKLEIRRHIRDSIKTYKKIVTIADPNDMVGKRVAVYWELDGVWYLGTICGYNRKNRMHDILYDDTMNEEIVLKN